MPRTCVLCVICWLAMIQPGLAQELGQSEPPFSDPVAPQEQAPNPQIAPQRTFAPDDPKLLLMIRNTIIALNQANLTGNYSVLRDMGTPNFQQSNSQARLSEAFSGLRARKIDISPIMFFNPKFATPPALQDGQLLRVAGAFPTTPEQVNFDLALQILDDRWMIAALAVNVAPPGENAQGFAQGGPSGHIAEASDTKPIRIDLTQASMAPPQQGAAPKKPVVKKPKPNPQKTATAAQPAATSPSQQPPHQAPLAQPPGSPSSNPNGQDWNPFGGDR